MEKPIHNVLFLCTGNSARSIIAEAVLNTNGAGRFRAWSAGSQPKGDVHPMALKVLSEFGFETQTLRSKSWDEFAKPDSPQFDFIFTVCDNAAGEVCPIWPGHPMTAHWGIEDPAAVEGVGQQDAFVSALTYLRVRIDLLLDIPIGSLDPLSLRQALNSIGCAQGATSSQGKTSA
jgi:arsenate reductase